MTHIDYTRLREKLIPTPDGEPPIILRTATVDAVNTDGTVDLEMSSGVIIPDVPRQADAYAPVGAVVNVLSFRGSLLVIGAAATFRSQGRPSQTGDQNVSTGGVSAATFVQAVVFPDPYPVGVVPVVMTNLDSNAAAAQLWVVHAADRTNTGFNIYGSRNPANTLPSVPVNWIAFAP